MSSPQSVGLFLTVSISYFLPHERYIVYDITGKMTIYWSNKEGAYFTVGAILGD